MWIETHSKLFNTDDFEVVDVDCGMVIFTKFLAAPDADGCPVEASVCINMEDYSEVFNEGLRDYDDSTNYWMRWVARKLFTKIADMMILSSDTSCFKVTDEVVMLLLRECIEEEKRELAENDS